MELACCAARRPGVDALIVGFETRHRDRQTTLIERGACLVPAPCHFDTDELASGALPNLPWLRSGRGEDHTMAQRSPPPRPTPQPCAQCHIDLQVPSGRPGLGGRPICAMCGYGLAQILRSRPLWASPARSCSVAPAALRPGFTTCRRARSPGRLRPPPCPACPPMGHLRSARPITSGSHPELPSSPHHLRERRRGRPGLSPTRLRRPLGPRAQARPA